MQYISLFTSLLLVILRSDMWKQREFSNAEYGFQIVISLKNANMWYVNWAIKDLCSIQYLAGFNFLGPFYGRKCSIKM